MDNRIYLINLYDYYGDLLTDKQKKYFEDYYFNNYSLKEISENYNVSRNAIFKQIKDVVNKLSNYEEKLELYSKSLKIKAIISDFDDKIRKEIEELI